MSVREIKILGDPVLRKPAEEILEFGEAVEALAKDMLETMYKSSGIGLAGPQIGVSERILVLDLNGSEDGHEGPVTLVNPRVVEASRVTDRAPEGCLSIPGMEEVVERPAFVTVEGMTPSGEPVTFEAEGLFSRVLQHEIDHLDGVLFIDRLSPLKRKLAVRKWHKAQEEVDS